MSIRLRHGGIMANYKCNAACRHCLYSCSPRRSGGYITREAAEDVCRLLRQGGCRSVHIGGGEPFLDFEGLITLVSTVAQMGITVNYVETNGFWAKDGQQTSSCLRRLREAGAEALCISIDPFHAEYVPFARPLFLAEICKKERFEYFLWQEKFLKPLSKADGDKTLSRRRLEELLSPDYILRTAESYGLRIGGRAVGIEIEYADNKPIDVICDKQCCDGLLSTMHFHVDLYGRFIPPGCTGIAIPLAEVVDGIPDDKYPAWNALLSEGIYGLYSYAQGLGFKAAPQGYPSKCTFCFYVRQWLSKQNICPELDAEHYENSYVYDAE